MTGQQTLTALVERFADSARATLLVPGAKAEVSLYGSLHTLVDDALALLSSGGWVWSQQVGAGEFGVPDFRLDRAQQLRGWLEFKAVIGKDLAELKGHDEEQRKRFVDGLANLVLTNGWQWWLYQNGKRVAAVTIGPPSMFDPQALPHHVSGTQAVALADLLSAFLTASPVSFTSAASAVRALAARARALKSALLEAGAAAAPRPLVDLQKDFRALLYRNGQPFTWERFVDSYVQLATFGALLWRLETGKRIGTDKIVALSPGVHPLLSQCLNILWQPSSRLPVLEPLLEELCGTVNLVEPALFAPSTDATGTQALDPVVHAYEPFFQVYDAAAREKNGVFYTPVQLVQHIVSGVDHHLGSGLHRPDGLLEEEARYLDPATGTGTFLLGLLSAVAARAAGAGLPADQAARDVFENQTAAFEIFPGPYALAHQRLEAALTALGAAPTKRLPIYLTDTLAAPESGQLPSGSFGSLGSGLHAEREEADRLKTAERILVILGNPPYERLLQGSQFEAFTAGLIDQVKQATPPEMRKDFKSAKDLFVAFWAWALWALQSPDRRVETSAAPTIDTRDCTGMVAYVTNSTWLSGRSLAGLRALVRRGATEVWVLDLGGDSRGAHGAQAFAGGDGNVFNIRVGVAVVWAVFDRQAQHTGQPPVRYRRLYGTRAHKLAQLATPFDPTGYEVVPGVGAAPFAPVPWAVPAVAAAPTLGELFSDEPETGLQSARDSGPVSPVGLTAADVLAVPAGGGGAPAVGRLAVWAAQRGAGQRQSQWETAKTKREGQSAPAPTSLDPAKVRPYLYRPLDVRWLYDEPAWIDWDRPGLRAVYTRTRGEDGTWDEARVPSLVTLPGDHGRGPAVMHVSRLMDQHCFNNRGGKGIYPLWLPWQRGEHVAGRPVDGRALHGAPPGRRSGWSRRVLDWLDEHGRSGDHQAAYDYVLAVLTAPAYTFQHWRALEADQPRVPLTRDRDLFREAVRQGVELRAAWDGDAPASGASWGGTPSSAAPFGDAHHDGGAVTFTNGRVLHGVASDDWAFELSGYAVLPRWLHARRAWTFTLTTSKQALQVVASVRRIVELGPALDRLLQNVTAHDTV